MSPDADADGRTATRVHEAIAEAGVGAETLFADLSSLEAIGEVVVEGRTATVSVTLPVPSEAVADELVTEIESAASGVAGIDSVAVRFESSAADPGERIDMLPEVKNVVAVASGKGGVGKSTTATNLAVALADTGARVGLLDADVYGPNAPTMLGLDGRTPDATADDRMLPRETHGVKVMSMSFIADEDDPVIWRGPLVDEFIKQLVGDVEWGALDYLVVDLPPGTGDAQLSLVQHLPVAGAVVVTTPQEVAVDDAARGLVGFARYDVPVLGVLENMAGFACPDCGEVHEIFGTGGADDLADQFEVPVLGRVPLDPAVGTLELDTAGTGESGANHAPGIDVPLLGRLQLPRTQAERERAGESAALPPMVVREDGGAARAQLRLAATRIAARLNQAAVQLES